MGDGASAARLPARTRRPASGRRTTQIVEVLRSVRPAARVFESSDHSYPHCWRHKTPVAFRATPQWFISMEQAAPARDALAAIDTVRWIPDWGEARIAGMIAGRPDWCISRQRTWGVPIALFVAPRNRAPHPRSGRVDASRWRIASSRAASMPGSTSTRAELLGDEAPHYDKVTDILDVWFDSGVTHACVLARAASASRRICTSKARTSIAAGSRALLTGVAMRQGARRIGRC
jgi:isoleucyl-tRNA synthetase